MAKREKRDVNVQAVELAIRMVKSGLGEQIWMEEHNIHPHSDLDAREVAACNRLGGELKLSDIKTKVSSGRNTCTVRITAMVARTVFSKAKEKVMATAKLTKWDDTWGPNEVDIKFRREICLSFDDDADSLPPLKPQKPNRVPKEKPVVVTVERFTEELYKDQALIRVSGGHGIYGDSEKNDFYSLITRVRAIKEATIITRLAGIEKEEGVEWDGIMPMLRNAFSKFFGKGVKVIEKMRRRVPEEDGMLLGEANLASMRDAMKGCALTEDECGALGIDFHQHHRDLVGSC